MKIILAALLAQAVLSVPVQSPIDYRFDQVKRTVVLNASQIAAGHHAQSGDKVQTGWFSYALIASDHYRARFEIFSSTDVKLAGGTPGVILTLERGKLHAMFDKITGSEPRVVQTPGALLAVRGTQYEVEVDHDGRTDLRVFEGTVEVRSRMQPERPVLVHAGEMTNFGRQDSPSVHPMPERGPRGQGMSQRDGHEHPEGGMQPPPHGQQPPPKPPSGDHH